MENELVVLQKIEQEVTKITKFDQTKEQLVAKVNETKNITAEDLRDQMQLAVVQRNRIDLRAIEIAIEKRGKGYRDIFTSANKQIMAKQNELLAITNPEVERLSAIEEEAKAIRIRDERVALLPNKKEKLKTLGESVVIVSDDELLEMDDQQFNVYYNQVLSDKLEDDRIASEQKMAAEQAKLDAQRLELEAEKQKIADAKFEAERQKQIEIDKKKAADEAVKLAKKQAEEDKALAVEAERKRADDDKKRLIEDQVRKEQEKAQAALDAQRAEDEERIRIEKMKTYQKFLKDNKYEEGNPDFYLLKEDNTITLFKKIASINV